MFVCYTLHSMDNRQTKISYLCKRYGINAALAAETLAQLDDQRHKPLTIEQLATICDELDGTN